MHGFFLASLANTFSPVLFDAGFKSFLLLFATAIAAWLLRRRSAATVHRVWTLGFCGLIALPCIAPLVPTWSLPIVPKSWSVTPISLIESDRNTAPFVAEPDRSARSNRVETNAPFPTEDSIQSSANVIAIPRSAPAENVIAPATESANARIESASHREKAKFNSTDWIGIVVIIWLAGAGLWLTRIAIDHLRLYRIVREGTPIRDPSWLEIWQTACLAVGCHRVVEMRRVSRKISPMICGIIRPIIILPKHAEEWDAEGRQLVLLHEMAHARRHDVVSQTLAQLACAVYWFNPLAWFGISQMRKYRELACDDLVIETGQRPSDYAHLLLDVARSCQQQRLLTAVGMARSNDIETRILALLDRVRSHVSLSKRTARRLMVMTAVLVALTASLRLQLQADQPTPSLAKPDSVASAKKDAEQGSKVSDTPADEGKTANQPPQFRKTRIFAADEQGKSLRGTKIKVNVLESGGKSMEQTLDYVTGNDGSVEVKLPKHYFSLQLWADLATYVPMHASFEDEVEGVNLGNQDIADVVADTFRFVMKRGIELSGRVVDEHHQPIAGVKVNVTSKPRGAGDSPPKPSTHPSARSYDSWDAAVTDSQGIWTIAEVRGPTTEFHYSVRLKHKDFISDEHDGGLQHEQNITSDMLIQGNATITMKRGSRIHGSVADVDGHPITKGIVIWSDQSQFNHDTKTVKINDKGEYQTDVVTPGEYPITIIAPGYAPDLRKIRIGNSSERADFVLSRGKRIAIRILDSEGSPLKDAIVQIDSWRGLRSLYNTWSSDLTNPGIPVHPDASGLFTWDWAPEDAVKYQISAIPRKPGPDFLYQVVSLVPQEAEHRIKLIAPLGFSGNVTDASTGKPVPKFAVIPVDEFRPKFLSTNYSRLKNGRDGHYELKDLVDRLDGRRHYIRIEASGYRTAISQNSYAPDQGPVTVDFALEPVAALPGRVIDPIGLPAAKALVILGTPSVVPHVDNSNSPSGHMNPVIVTDEDGRFEIAASFEPTRIRIIHESGVAEVDRQIDEPLGTLALKPWAKVTGQLLQEGLPVPRQQIYFDNVIQRNLEEPRFQERYSCTTDANGRFTFDRLPPMSGHLHAYLGPWQHSPLTSSQSSPLELQPGENRTVDLGGRGISVTGKIVAIGRGEIGLDANWSLNYLVKRHSGIELPRSLSLGFDPNAPMQSSWHLDPHLYEWLATRESYFVKLNSDGILNIHGVPAGEYDLSLQLYEQPAGCLVETIGLRVVPVIVTDADVAKGRKDLGQIDVECRVGPRLGQNMSAYHFVDVSGRQKSIHEMRGQYVLMHVWASWCAPCLETMPAVQASLARAPNQRIVAVGLNVDDDATKARELVARNNWNWAQNYLGGHSEMAKQLAISSVPVYYLINREGLLITSTTEWSKMEKKLENLED